MKPNRPTQPGAVKRRIGRQHDVELEPGLRVNHVELKTLADRLRHQIPRAVIFGLGEGRAEGVHMLRLEVDDNVHVVGQARLAVSDGRH